MFPLADSLNTSLAVFTIYPGFSAYIYDTANRLSSLNAPVTAEDIASRLSILSMVVDDLKNLMN